ncbi:MAG: hypothetical protein OEZ36_03240 [Spirochaetota bacterium]|nr:hypothetical protein [Spirochaetota bacterium]
MAKRKSSWFLIVIALVILILIVDYTILKGKYITQPIRNSLQKAGIVEKTPLEKVTTEGEKLLDKVLNK